MFNDYDMYHFFGEFKGSKLLKSTILGIKNVWSFVFHIFGLVKILLSLDESGNNVDLKWNFFVAFEKTEK